MSWTLAFQDAHGPMGMSTGTSEEVERLAAVTAIEIRRLLAMAQLQRGARDGYPTWQ